MPGARSRTEVHGFMGVACLLQCALSGLSVHVCMSLVCLAFRAVAVRRVRLCVHDDGGRQGNGILFVMVNGSVEMALSVADSVRPNAAEVIAELHRLKARTGARSMREGIRSRESRVSVRLADDGMVYGSCGRCCSLEIAPRCASGCGRAWYVLVVMAGVGL